MAVYVGIILVQRVLAIVSLDFETTNVVYGKLVNEMTDDCIDKIVVFSRDIIPIILISYSVGVFVVAVQEIGSMVVIGYVYSTHSMVIEGLVKLVIVIDTRDYFVNYLGYLITSMVMIGS